jgi:23S rRNA pseudouridine1911/1915/1917 synthase
VETIIGRSPRHRQKMTTRTVAGRRALTRYRVREELPPCALLEVRPLTGRTHQIRVHAAHLGHPVVGDRVYGRARNVPLPAPAPRQMLHAWQLGFEHPATGQELRFEADPPEDLQVLLRALRAALPG